MFFTQWCPQSKTYRWVFHDPGIVALSRRFVVIRIDRDQEDGLNTLYAKGENNVPRTLFLRKARAVDRSARGSDLECLSRSNPENCSECELLHTSSPSRWAILSSNQDGSTLRQHEERDDDEAKPEEARSAVPPGRQPRGVPARRRGRKT